MIWDLDLAEQWWPDGYFCPKCDLWTVDCKCEDCKEKPAKPSQYTGPVEKGMGKEAYAAIEAQEAQEEAAFYTDNGWKNPQL